MDPLKYSIRRSTCPESRQSELLLRHKLAQSKNLFSKNLVGHYGCVNALEFSHGLGSYLASGGDDRRVLVWNVEKALSDIGKPSVMKGEHNSNIFCLAFDVNNSTLFSGGNDEQVIVHDIDTGITKDVFLHDDAVYGLSPDPVNPHVFASSCDDGRVLIYDIRDSSGDPFCLANYTSSMHSVMYNPVEPRLLATANAKEGVGLWDVRMPRSCLFRYGVTSVQQSCMSVRFNQHGDRIIALRRRLPPVLYKIDSSVPVCEFDHSGYYNSCTMKSVTFAGDLDQYVISGSDEFNLYMWAVPEDLSERLFVNSAHMVLKGHRSIVNQVRFNPSNHLIVSSGVEKIIKAWSPFQLPSKQSNEENDRKLARHRPVYSHEEYINLVLENGHVMSHDYSHESTEEDPRMIAFFDSLVQRELEGISSDDSLSSNEEALYSRIVQLSQSDIDSDDSLNEPLEQNSDDEPNFSPFTIAFASVMASQAAEGNDRYPRLNNALNNRERRPQDSTSTPDQTNSSNDPAHADITRGMRDISRLVQKKKFELRQNMHRRVKDCSAKLSSSSSLDVSESSDDSLSDLDKKDVSNEETNEEVIESSGNNLTEMSKRLWEKEKECKKRSEIKLKKLRNLRRSVLQSDSEASDTEDKGKNMEVHCLTSTPVSSLKSNDESVEKVTFKKIKKRTSDSTVDDEKEKPRSSPDLGPYLQKTGPCNSNVESRKTMEDKEWKKGKKILPEESVTGKGKVKQRGDSEHKHDPYNDRIDMLNEKSDSLFSTLGKAFKCEETCALNSKDVCNIGTGEKEIKSANLGVKTEESHNSDRHGDLFKKKLPSKIIFNKNVNRSGTIRHRSASPTTSERQNLHSEKRRVKDTDDLECRIKHRKGDYVQRHLVDKHTNNINHTNSSDTEAPSCSYSVRKETGNRKTKRGPCRHHPILTSDSGDEICSSKYEREKEESSEDDQPTWSEFKKFKNRLERARHRYREHKKHKKQRRFSDDR